MELEEVERKLKETIKYRDSLEESNDLGNYVISVKINYLNEIIDELINKRVMLINELPDGCNHKHLYLNDEEIVCLDCGVKLTTIDNDLSNYHVLYPTIQGKDYCDELIMIYDKLKEYKSEKEAFEELVDYNEIIKLVDELEKGPILFRK